MLDNPELTKAGISLTTHAGKQGVKKLFDKMRLSQETDTLEDQIIVLKEIVTELINEKNELINIAQVYDEQLVAQKISGDDVEYISTNIVPLLEKFFTDDGKGDDLSEQEKKKKDEDKENFELVKPLLSKETFNILQSLGFNYKKAIGEPLTDVLNNVILNLKVSAVENELDFKKMEIQKELEFIKMINNPEAYERYKNYLKL